LSRVAPVAAVNPPEAWAAVAYLFLLVVKFYGFVHFPTRQMVVNAADENGEFLILISGRSSGIKSNSPS